MPSIQFCWSLLFLSLLFPQAQCKAALFQRKNKMYSSKAMIPLFHSLRLTRNHHNLAAFGFVRTSSTSRVASVQSFRKNVRRFVSTTNAVDQTSRKTQMTILDTPLGKHKSGSLLLDGLDVYTIPASGDDHPLTVYGIDSENIPAQSIKRKPILLLHGRTWSSVPVYHLLGGPKAKAIDQHESLSFMEALLEANLQPYAVDFRGFGGTPPHDCNHSVEPNRCVEDVETTLNWIAERHGLVQDGDGENEMPALFGWSQGALIAQLQAQKSPQLISKLVLYGSIYDPAVRYPRTPLFVNATHPNSPSTGQSSLSSQVDIKVELASNYYDGAIEDFTIEGSIAPEQARYFAEAALMADPIKARWIRLHQFNNCDPARVHTPTLVVAGDQDPYAPLRVQQELFSNLGRGADRAWSIIADADHAIHLLDGRDRFTKIVTSFVQNGKKGQKL